MSHSLRTEKHELKNRHRIRVCFHAPSKTLQQHAAACDINNIMNRYARTGSLPPPRGAPQFADVTGLQGDLTERVNFAASTIADVDSAIQKTLSAKVAESQPKQTPAAAPPPEIPAPAAS